MESKHTAVDSISALKLLVPGLLLMLGGCGTLYEVDIAASNPTLHSIGRNYVLVPANNAIASNSSEFQRYSSYVEQALSQKGLRRLPESEIANAEIEIQLAYSVGGPKTVGYESRTQMFEQRAGTGGEPRPSGSAGGDGNPTGGAGSPVRMPAPQPQQDLVGVNNHTFKSTHYEREVSLTAYPRDAGASGDNSAEDSKPIWWLSGSSDGSSTDMDDVIPVLAAAIAPYVGDNSVSIIKTKIGGLDSRVKAIREGASQH